MWCAPVWSSVATGRKVVMLVPAVIVLVATAAGAQSLTPVAPTGAMKTRAPKYTWNCTGSAEYRIELQRADGTKELTSDQKTVGANNGICTFPVTGDDQVRLWGGTLPPGSYRWRVVRADGTAGPFASFDIEPHFVAGFGADGDWMEVGDGWRRTDERATNDKGGTLTQFLMWRWKNPTQPEANALQAGMDAYVTLGIGCPPDTVRCEAGYIMSAYLNPSVTCGETGQPVCRPPDPYLQVAIDNRQELIIRISFNGVRELHRIKSDAILQYGMPNRLRINKRWSYVRVYVNDVLVFCGSDNRFSPANGIFSGVTWLADKAIAEGEGLTIERLAIAQGPDVMACFVPYPEWSDVRRR